VPGPEPFRILDCALIAIALGKTAQNLRELRDRILELPPSSLWHHLFETLLRPGFDDPEYRSDFALWARRHLHDAVLAERLAALDPTQTDDVEQLRQQLVDIVEDHIAETNERLGVPPGHELHFLRSQIVVLDTGRRATTPGELGAHIPELPLGSIYLHFVDARRRHVPDRVDDFTKWLESFGEETAALRAQLARVDFYQWSLSEMRDRIGRCFGAIPARVA